MELSDGKYYLLAYKYLR